MNICGAQNRVYAADWGRNRVVKLSTGRGTYVWRSSSKRGSTEHVSPRKNAENVRLNPKESEDFGILALVRQERRLQNEKNCMQNPMAMITTVCGLLLISTGLHSSVNLMSGGAILWQLYGTISSWRPRIVKHKFLITKCCAIGAAAFVALGLFLVEATSQGESIAALYAWFCYSRVSGTEELTSISPFLSAVFDWVCEGFDFVLRRGMMLALDWMLLSLQLGYYLELLVMFCGSVYLYHIAVLLSQEGLAFLKKPRFPKLSWQCTIEFSIIYAIVNIGFAVWGGYNGPA
ncbi:hypothetical protein BSKO_03186 [Bryopsis sp. KO-2023]|nr:hypothetical protein BSKO_03186 [Bryopsis sp. KO-2023]